MARRRSWIIDSVMLTLVLGTWPVKLFRDAPDMRVTAEPVTEGRIPAPIVANGTVRAVATVTIEPKVPGRLHAIEVLPRTIVHAGDVLARLEPDEYRAALSAAQATLSDAEEDLHTRELALETVERQRSTAADLAAGDVLAPLAVQAADLAVSEARGNLLTSEERVAEARAAFSRAAADMQQTILSAPVDGLVLSVSPVGPTFSIATDLAHVEVDAPLPERGDVVRAGDTATVSDGDREIRGEIVAIEHNPDGRTNVVVDVPARATDLQPGTAVAVALDGARRPPVVRVPNAALTFAPPRELLDAIGETRVPSVSFSGQTNSPLSQVWTYDGCEFTAVNVRTGYRNARFTELIDGPLHPGDMLVTGASMAAH